MPRWGTRSGWAPNTGGCWKARLDQRRGGTVRADPQGRSGGDAAEEALRDHRGAAGRLGPLACLVQHPATPPGPSQPGEAAVAGHPRVPDPAGIEGSIAKKSRTG